MDENGYMKSMGGNFVKSIDEKIWVRKSMVANFIESIDGKYG